MTTPVDPSAALGAAQAAGGDDVAAKLKRAAARGDEGGLRDAARQFEGYLVRSMVKQMREATASEGGLFSGSAMSTWNDMFDQEIADRIVEGPGLGLADDLVSTMRARYGAGASSVSSVLGGGPDGWSWPLPSGTPGRITSGFGHRDAPVAGASTDHRGLDLAAPEGTAVLAMASGTVVRAGAAAGYGNVVDVDHGDGVVTRYAHQASLDVDVGDAVDAGARLGAVGTTGRTTGAHLHLEIRVDGDAVDPLEWLRRRPQRAVDLP